jgi:hypothetical protein
MFYFNLKSNLQWFIPVFDFEDFEVSYLAGVFNVGSCDSFGKVAEEVMSLRWGLAYFLEFSANTKVTTTPTRTSRPIGINTPKNISPSLSANVIM